MLNEKQIARRLIVLREAADVLFQLREELPCSQASIDLARNRLRLIADRYEERASVIRELATAERKPPQRARVSVQGRRRKVHAPTDPLGMVATLNAIRKPRGDE